MKPLLGKLLFFSDNDENHMYAINEDIIKKFVWIPDLLEKVLRNETTPAVKNSMNTIAKRVLGHGLIFSALYRLKIEHSDWLRATTGI